MPFADAKYPKPPRRPYVVVFGNLIAGLHIYGPFASNLEALAWSKAEGVQHGAVSGHACWIMDINDPDSLGKEVVCLT